MQIYVGNLPNGYRLSDLVQIFETYGCVSRASAVRDFAFLAIYDNEAARAAINGLNGNIFGDQEIVVEQARFHPRNRFQNNGRGGFAGARSGSQHGGNIEERYDGGNGTGAQSSYYVNNNHTYGYQGDAVAGHVDGYENDDQGQQQHNGDHFAGEDGNGRGRGFGRGGRRGGGFRRGRGARHGGARAYRGANGFNGQQEEGQHQQQQQQQQAVSGAEHDGSQSTTPAQQGNTAAAHGNAGNANRNGAAADHTNTGNETARQSGNGDGNGASDSGEGAGNARGERDGRRNRRGGRSARGGRGAANGQQVTGGDQQNQQQNRQQQQSGGAGDNNSRNGAAVAGSAIPSVHPAAVVAEITATDKGLINGGSGDMRVHQNTNVSA